MKHLIRTMIFCVIFVSAAFAAESPEQSPFVTRGKAMGDTGGLPSSDTPRPRRANSSSSDRLQRADTIKLNFPRKTSSGEGEKKFLYKSPRDESMGVSLALSKKKEIYSLSKAPELKIVSSPAEKK